MDPVAHRGLRKRHAQRCRHHQRRPPASRSRATAEVLTTPSTFVWSVAADPNGTAYVGTASPASVLRIGKDGKPFTLFETTDLSVQVVRLGPDGLLYVATLPSGKVYRLHPDATAKQDENTAALLFDAAKPTAKPAPSVSPEKPTSAKPAEVSGASEKSDSKSHYIWDMTFDPKGRLYIATGGPAAVYRVDPAKPTATARRILQVRRRTHPHPRLGQQWQSHRRL
jgi:WD40 repeat protein